MKSIGLGHLFQRGRDSKGKPCGNYSLQFNISGKRKIINLGTDDLKDAEKKRKEYLDEAKSLNTKTKVLVHIAENRNLITSSKLKLDKVWETFKESTNKHDSSSGTLGNHERNWNKFRLWLKTEYPTLERINQITATEAEKYMAKLWAGGMSPATYNYHLQSLKYIFKILETSDNPLGKIKKKQLNREESLKNPFTLEQVNNILAAFDNPELLKMNIRYQDEMKTMFYLGAYTGARLIDCALMKRGSINLAQRSISYVPIKTQRINRKVTIPIWSEQLFNHLSRCMAEKSTSEYLLPNVSARYKSKGKGEKGIGGGRAGVVNDSIKVFAFCGIRDKKDRTPKAEREQRENTGKQRLNVKVEYGFHSFRHFLGTHLANKGTPIKTLAEMLGDDVTTTSHYYIQVSGEEKKNAMKNLLLDGDKQETSMTVSPISEPSSIKERVSKALELIRKADSIQIDETFRAELLELLK